MTAKAMSADFENAIHAYIQGMSAENAATLFHTSEQRLSDELKARGLFRSKAQRETIKREKRRRRILDDPALPVDDIVSRYIAGESENVLAQAFGVSRSAITARLRHANIARRSQTEANQLLAQQTPIEEHRRRIKIAQDAVRGSTQTFKHRCNVAKGTAQTLANTSESENVLAEWLRSRGMETIPQQAVGPYNIDLGAFPIAVEILGGAWHASKPKHAKRSRYILDQGWHLVFVWNHAKRSPLLESAADYIVTFAQEVGCDPSSIRQYRVIRGDGQELARGQADSEHITPVVPGYESMNGRPIN